MKAVRISCKTAVAADNAFTFNPAALAPIQKPARYDEFWAGYGRMPFDDLVSVCCKPTKEEIGKRTSEQEFVGSYNS